MKYIAVDLFSGGGLSLGMRQAGFKVISAIEIDKSAVATYWANNPNTKIFNDDIKNIETDQVKELLKGQPLHLLAGCPPCQGFSSVRRRNGKNVRDERNALIFEYLQFVAGLEPLTIMMENVSGLTKYYLFKFIIAALKNMGYNISFEVVNVKDYGVPQRRKRMVLVGSKLGKINVVNPTGERRTVRDAIGKLKPIELDPDPLHKSVTNHSERIKKIISLIPKDGGSRKDLPAEYILECHNKENVGFADIYGRLKWDDYSSTITGGCLNPSKGRFLHPEEDRALTPREASLLQTFPRNYIFPTYLPKVALGRIIGEALPPKFGKIQCYRIKQHLDMYIGGQIST